MIEATWMPDKSQCKYHKINTLFKRSEINNIIIPYEWTLPEFEDLKDCKWNFREKVDGINIVLIYCKGKFQFMGRNESSEIPKFLSEVIIEKYGSQEFIDKVDKLFPLAHYVIFYCEGFGPKTQSKVGKHYSEEHDLICFDIKYGSTWFSEEQVEDICLNLGFKKTPLILTGTLKDGIIKTISKYQSTISIKPVTAEGLIAVPANNYLTRNRSRIITKIKVKDFRDYERLVGEFPI